MMRKTPRALSRSFFFQHSFQRHGGKKTPGTNGKHIKKHTQRQLSDQKCTQSSAQHDQECVSKQAPKHNPNKLSNSSNTQWDPCNPLLSPSLSLSISLSLSLFYLISTVSIVILWHLRVYRVFIKLSRNSIKKHCEHAARHSFGSPAAA